MKKLGHRPGLDGLRGLAIIAVVGYHFRVPGFDAGWRGVDLFFVLSGFLITSLLREERERTGTVGLRRFYWRRAVRLFPALAAVLIVVGVAAPALPDTIRSSTVIGGVASFFYAANVALLFNLPGVGLLWHTWSLAAEEQFYAVWPLVMRRFSTAQVLAVCGVGYAICAAVRPLVSAEVASFAPVPRGAGLLVGAALGLLFARLDLAAVTTRVSGLLAVILGLVVTLPDGGFWSPVLIDALMGTVVLTSAVAPPRWLTFRPLIGAGAISYGWYLWHEPVNRLWNELVDQPLAVSIVAKLAISLALALGSWRLIEAPFLRMKGRFDAAPLRQGELPHLVVGGGDEIRGDHADHPIHGERPGVEVGA